MFRNWFFQGCQLLVACFLSIVCALFLLLLPSTSLAQDAVCAEVRIEIRQKVSMERQAFDAVLRIRNGLATGSVENVSVDVLFSDLEGNPVIASSDPSNTAAMFFIRLDDMDGIGDVGGSGVVPPESTAAIRWIIIPSASAGGNTPAGIMYRVGARLQYRLNGEDTIVDVVPETITVRPQPRLALDYFLAGDVYSDDPFTPEVEPAIPFTLGLRVRNTGAGTGHKISIESAQPQIVDNEQGLLIGFNITGGHVDDQPVAPSLQIDLGDISPGGVRMARWLMETTLSGRFTAIDVRYTHADELGGALTSLLDGEPAAHLLVRDVLIDLPGRDGIRDFLARDGDVLRVYESNGIDSEVTDRSEDATLVLVPGRSEYTLSFPSTQGFSYVQLVDPTHGQASGLSVRRSDGRLLPSENVWFSKSRRQNLSWAYYLNIFDANGGGTYTVTMDTAPATAALSGHVYVDANGNGVQDAGEVGLDGVTILLEGVTLGGNVQRSTISQNGTYRFAELPEGVYAISVAASVGYANGTHQAGSIGGVLEVDRISQIALGAGTEASGYVFAKVPEAASRMADLQVMSLQGHTTVTVGADTAITVQVRNIGPHAALAQTNVALPVGFTVKEAAVSSGNFDVATGLWSHGVLLPGQQHSLMAQGVYSQQGLQASGVTIHALDGDVEDPEPGNNTRTLEVLVEPSPTLAVVLERARISDLLVWVSCPQDAPRDCVDVRAQRWSALLSQAQVRHRIETDSTSFVAALRSGEWPSIWVDGGIALSQGTISAEIRENLRRGGSVILSGRRNFAWAGLESLAGATHQIDLPEQLHSVELLQSNYFQEGTMEATGVASVYSADPDGVLAYYGPGMAAAVAMRNDLSATALVFGFDPLPGMEAQAEPASFVAHLMRGAAVWSPDVVLDKSRISLQIAAYRAGTEDVLTVAAGLPENFQLLSVNPVPTSATPTSLSWLAALPLPNSTFEAKYVLRTPEGSAAYAFDVITQWRDEESQNGLGIEVRNRQQQAIQAGSALDQLQVVDPQDAILKQTASTQLIAAQAAYEQGNQEDAIATLLMALQALDDMSATGASNVALEFSRLLLAMSREAPINMEPEIFDDGFEGSP